MLFSSNLRKRLNPLFANSITRRLTFERVQNRAGLHDRMSIGPGAQDSIDADTNGSASRGHDQRNIGLHPLRTFLRAHTTGNMPLLTINATTSARPAWVFRFVMTKGLSPLGVVRMRMVSASITSRLAPT